MKPSEFKRRAHDSYVVRIALFKYGAMTTCPLGCQNISVEARAIGTIHFGPHRQDHPNSQLCYWSGREILDEINGQAVEITLLSGSRMKP